MTWNRFVSFCENVTLWCSVALTCAGLWCLLALEDQIGVVFFIFAAALLLIKVCVLPMLKE